MTSRTVASSLRLSLFALLLAACGGPILGQDGGDGGDASRDARVDAPIDSPADVRADVVDIIDAPPTDIVDVPADAADATDAPDAVDAPEDVIDVESDAADEGDADGSADAEDGADAPSDTTTCADTLCGAACVDLQTDPTHCGSCATDCTALPGVTGSAVTCVAGVCTLTGACATGRADCNSDPTDGCEVDLASPDHCGTCSMMCPGSDDACQTRTCSGGTCGMSFVAAGTPLATQVSGDCRIAICNGSGGTSSTPDDTDIASDSNDCTTDTCVAGSPVHTPLAAGSACTQNGGSLCNAVGNCVQCNAPTDCAGTDTACSMRSCSAGTCGITFVPAGASTATQSPGDCHRDTCDGSGTVVTVVDDTDVPVDANQCTDNVCNAGVPSNPASPAGTMCTQSGGARCDGSGNCVGCVTASDCPGTDTECRARACNAGTCGFTFVAAGTRVTAQVAGDCRANQCDGSGNIVSAPDNTDVQDDSNQCTADTCSAGTPVHTPLATGTTCTQNGGRFCSATATCVACLSASDCPAATNECAMAACNAGACGFDFAPNGTPATTQSPGDCQQRVCNGSGAIVSTADNTDVPVDGNACTQDICTAGVPSHPNSPTGTACAMNGGVVCNGSGACVQCLAAADCPGTDTGCTPRACSAGVCGTTNAPAGTPTGTQTTGDCQTNVCNGSGGTTTTPDNTDVPVDGNQCTNDVCTSGVPSNPPSAMGTACSQSGGTVCSGLGACVQCNSGADCASSVCVLNVCQAPSCVDGVRNGTETGTDCGGTCPACPPPTLVINEIDYDQIGTDAAEYVEIYNTGTLPIDLSNYAIVLVNGSTNAEYLRVALSGVLLPGGYAVAANAAVVVPVGTLRFSIADGTVQNGAPDGVALIDTTSHTLVDALSYEGPMTSVMITGFSGPVSLVEGTVLPTAVADSNTANGSLSRLPNGTDTNNAATDWSFSSTPTPGAANVP